MLDAIFRPVIEWPGKKTDSWKRKNAIFRVSYPKRLDALEYELNHLRAKDIVIQAFFDRKDIRNDGWPRSSARPKEPGIVVTFSSNKQVFSYPCDTYTGWEDNLYAIALSFEALRAVDRYGVTKRGEQYKGFAQIEAPVKANEKDGAVRFIAFHANVRNEDVTRDLDGAYRIAARKLHPDTGGSHDLFVQLQRHYSFLKGTP